MVGHIEGFSEESLLEKLGHIDTAIQEYESRKVEELFIDENEKWRCGECDEIRLEDKRVEAKLKCSVCSYLKV